MKSASKWTTQWSMPLPDDLILVASTARELQTLLNTTYDLLNFSGRQMHDYFHKGSAKRENVSIATEQPYTSPP